MSAPSPSTARERLLAAVSTPLRALALRGQLRSYRKNSVVIHEGDPGEALFVLLHGSVKAYATDENGREIIYGTIHAGGYFGEMSLDGGPRSASVMTLEPCTCAVVPCAAVREHLTQEPGFALDLVLQVIQRARAATETARQMALLDVYGRVAATLEGQCGPARTDAPVLLAPITHQGIASRVGASREMVSRLLKDLERGGYVELGVKRIMLKKKLPARW
ncbi:Crp/Fnr family transcriptional regulator [Ramlibacter tataouinensis]|uniref:Transcriptional regulator, CRP family-like protein n=1 Tax=Ramlibacter tataouinensis (strain ATCC BAA-407 / DSM 14655 / LMG 21543 / TTB310) TaxID=365046 RepID=F5XW54_RAMTT|nr:Crp/Fnr family transcriptional regulator [Ramlibacter tataouinensis]AEG91624.1 transcriptional regulator, CRP family-like protein [Ramlibacter tataouinensis TTB310]